MTIFIFLFHYVSWRLASFPFSAGFSSVQNLWMSIVLTVELLALTEFVQYLTCIMFQKNRTEQAKVNKDKIIKLIKKDPTSAPSVSIIIPTLNEDVDIVGKTIRAALMIDYPKKQVFVLDDGNRPTIKEIAERIGAVYINREGNQGAKAGNINNALKQITSDLILVFDADFVAFKDCLINTVGFFLDDPKLSTLQMPQQYFNADASQHNLRISKSWGSEQEVFFSRVMPGRDFLGASYCCGSCCLIRTNMLKEIGGFPEWSITEDILLTVEFLKKKWKTYYLNLPIARGIAAETNNNFYLQRKRWGRGNIEVGNYLLRQSKLDIKSKFLFYPFYWIFQYPTKIFLQCVPIVFFLFDLGPLPTSLPGEIFLYQGSFVICLCTSMIYMQRPYYLPIFSEASNLHSAIALAPEMISAYFKNKKGGFKFVVTPKNKTLSNRREKDNIYKRTIIPVMVLLAFNILSFLKVLFGLSYQSERVEISLVIYALAWSVINIVILLICFNLAIDKNQPRMQHRFIINRECKILAGSSIIHPSYLIDMSMSGALIHMNEPRKILDTQDNLKLQVGDASIPIKSLTPRDQNIVAKFNLESETDYQNAIEILYSGTYRPSESSEINRFLPTLKNIIKEVFNI